MNYQIVADESVDFRIVIQLRQIGLTVYAIAERAEKGGEGKSNWCILIHPGPDRLIDKSHPGGLVVLPQVLVENVVE